MPRPPCPVARAFAAAAAALLVLAWAGAARAQEASLEYAVKAAFLTKFPPFVEWRRDSSVGDAGFSLCVVGHDPFGAVLDRAAAGQHVGDRPVAVRRMEAVAADSGCRVVFAGGSPAQPVAAILAALHGAPVLTVTDGGREPGDTGIINFVIVDNRVRFAIDDGQAEADGLAISSKLLSLAVAVRPGQ